MIPFSKPSIAQEEMDEVLDTLRDGWLTTGPKTRRFEAEFAQYIGSLHAVAVNSCTAALHLGLEAVGVQAGDTVIVPTMTFAATADVVAYFNARPLLVDCREDDFNLDVADAQEKIDAALKGGARITAIIPVHYAGQIGDVGGVSQLARKYQLKIVEDAAHCARAQYRENDTADWQNVGSSADVCSFSFYANKPLTTGEGGMACTQVETYADRMRLMSLHGISKSAMQRYGMEGAWQYEIIEPGFKYNLTDIAAAIGLHQLRKADHLQRERMRWWSLYCELLGDIEELLVPAIQPNRTHSCHLFVVRLKLEQLKVDRTAIIKELNAAGITASVHWLPLHMHPYYQEKYNYQPSDLPKAASLYPEIISLPLYPEMTVEDVTYVCQQLRGILARNLKSAR